ncbi:hypothetical protein J6590_013841 [Homalodisca vitripennis]|nr:hypothetical protein J6590_013841 [Homalodisca vitripennis]
MKRSTFAVISRLPSYWATTLMTGISRFRSVFPRNRSRTPLSGPAGCQAHPRPSGNRLPASFLPTGLKLQIAPV